MSFQLTHLEKFGLNFFPMRATCMYYRNLLVVILLKIIFRKYTLPPSSYRLYSKDTETKTCASKSVISPQFLHRCEIYLSY